MRRFIDTMDLFFQAIAQQARDRSRGDVPSFEEYVALRWDTSGCRPCFALLEYAAGMDLPDEVVTHPIIRALEEALEVCSSENPHPLLANADLLNIKSAMALYSGTQTGGPGSGLPQQQGHTSSTPSEGGREMDVDHHAHGGHTVRSPLFPGSWRPGR